MSWPPVTQVGSLRRCPAPVVVIASGWIPNQVSFFRRIPLVPSYELYLGSFDGVDRPGIFITLGTAFQPSITLFERKCLLISSLADCCLKFRGPQHFFSLWLRFSTFWNQVTLFTLSKPFRISNVCNISVWWRRSSSVVRPNSLSFYSYDWPFKPEIIGFSQRLLYLPRTMGTKLLMRIRGVVWHTVRIDNRPFSWSHSAPGRCRRPLSLASSTLIKKKKGNFHISEEIGYKVKGLANIWRNVQIFNHIRWDR